METISIEIPTELLSAAKLKPEDIEIELIKEFFRQGRLTTSQVRSLAGKSIRLEEIFLKNEQSGNIDMDAFISWAAHDLRSPLNAINGFTKVVLKGIDGPINELQATDLTSAHVNGLRMLALTNNLIDMARLNNGNLTIEITAGNLSQTLTDVSKSWKTQNPTKELQTEIKINAPAFAFDSARLRQIISGLLTYASNHVAEEGKITLLAQDDDHEIRFDISSSGVKAIDKFEMDLTMLEFICRGLIGLHGGSLNIDTDDRIGISLSFSLPRN
jgi:signal transduction histidine kinase